MITKKRLSLSQAFILLWMIFLLGSFLALQYFPYPWLDFAWIRLFLAANIASFLLFGIDKFQAQTKGKRVPEYVLYLASLLGGPIGALLAMHLFRHKTRKLSFQLVLALILLLQMLIVWLMIKK